MRFFQPEADELTRLRADPLLSEQELDVQPEVADAIERATGIRAGRTYWRSAHDHLYALELGDLGRGRPSMATLFGHWDRYEPRPPEHEIDADLLSFCRWVAEISEGFDPANVTKVAQFAGIAPNWPKDSVLRTPSERFENLPDFPYEPRYVEIEGLRMAYVESGAGDPVLLLHGEPTWSYLYRRMIPALSSIGRVIAPDLIGFGRSDKPVLPNAYTYKSHVRWLRSFIRALELDRITLVCQDWGGLLGLRVLSEMPERFARVAAMNTGLPDGRQPDEAFMSWRRFALRAEWLDVPALMRRSLQRTIRDAELAAYGAPFPSKEYQTGALAFPRLVPIRSDDPGVYENRIAIEKLRALELPVLLPWATSDPITAKGERYLRGIFRNVAPPLPIEGAGHFLQEDAGEAVADHIVRWAIER
jgi:haloalkane dehalogenase